MRLVFIADKSQSYVDMQKEATLEQWKVVNADIQYIGHLGESGSVSLFGNPPVSILPLEKLEHVKGTVKALEQAIHDGTLPELVGNGLIITTQVPQRSLKKLNELVKAQGGTVIEPLHGGSSKLSPAAKLLQSLNFSREVRQVILDYVGEDYDSLIPIVRNLSDIPKNKHRYITVEEIMMRLPQTPGLVPLWEVWNEMERGNITEAIRTYRRFPKSASIGVVIHIKNTLSLAHRIAGLVELQPELSKKAMQEVTDVKSSFRFDKMKQLAQRNGVERLQKALDVISLTETRLKGGWTNAVSSEAVELALITLYRILKN